MLKKIFYLFVFIALTSYLVISFKTANTNEIENYVHVLNSDLKRGCGTMEYLEMQYKMDPKYKDILKQMEEFAEKFRERHSRKVGDNLLITIPVVVHVVWNTQIQNISDDQIYTQIDVLNWDFKRLNADTVNTPAPWKPIGADCQIEFKLAHRDPNGYPTNGITRTQTNITSFGLSSALKFTASGGRDAWDRDRYMNIWVANLGSGLLGYATFPGGNPSLDGVAIGYNYFGTIGPLTPPFNKGRTATHEVGHWLWLYHIWGDDNGSCSGTDFVEDTPNQASEFYGCPSFPQVDICTPNNPGVMFMNYMDYTDDACMNIFTQGQLGRINAALGGPRLPITTSNGHIPVSGIPICAFRADSLSIQFNNQVNFKDLSAGIPISWQWTFTGGSPSTSTQQNPIVTYPLPGLYTVKLKVTNNFGSDSLTKTSYIRVRGASLLPFNLISPINSTRIEVNQSDTSRVNFIWSRSSNNNSVTYKMKLRKIATTTDYIFTSNSNGQDSVVSVRKSLLDSIALQMGVTGDSVRCTWRVWAYNGIDSLASANSLLVTLVRSPIGIQIISNEIPNSFALYNNYPNPFNPVTTINFDIPRYNGDKTVNISIFDILGKEIEQILNQELQAGKYSLKWDASKHSSGIYFCKIFAGNFTDTKRMILVK